jgi:hypothetical protein
MSPLTMRELKSSGAAGADPAGETAGTDEAVVRPAVEEVVLRSGSRVDGWVRGWLSLDASVLAADFPAAGRGTAGVGAAACGLGRAACWGAGLAASGADAGWVAVPEVTGGAAVCGVLTLGWEVGVTTGAARRICMTSRIKMTRRSVPRTPPPTQASGNPTWLTPVWVAGPGAGVTAGSAVTALCITAGGGVEGGGVTAGVETAGGVAEATEVFGTDAAALSR